MNTEPNDNPMERQADAEVPASSSSSSSSSSSDLPLTSATNTVVQPAESTVEVVAEERREEAPIPKMTARPKKAKAADASKKASPSRKPKGTQQQQRLSVRLQKQRQGAEADRAATSRCLLYCTLIVFYFT